jgi:TonB-linked SusC/RagA family outer membrane protein
MSKLLTLLGAFLLLSSHSLFAQGTVTGKVTDSKNGEPLAGISVKIVGTNLGTSTAPDGTFSLTTDSSVTLEFSGVGFDHRFTAASPGQMVEIHLIENDKALNEVVVTALGIKREKRSLGYSTQTVGSEELNKSGTGNLFGELSGKVSGLSVTTSAGDPGAGTYILLRGATTLTGQNQPLMVVDGIPIDNSVNSYDPSNAGFQAGGPNGDLTGGAQPTNRGIDINPNDIESITVLKGPAATALYGTQAIGGALIITTKKGGGARRGPVVSLNSSVTFDKVGQLPPLQNKFAQGSDGVYNDPSTGQGVSWGPAIDTLSWDGTNTNPYDKHGNIVGNSDPTAKIPVHAYNPYDFFKTGITYDNNIAVSGGTEKGGYRVSLGNLYQTGIIPTTKYNKSTFSINGNSKLTDKLTVSAGMTYINSTNDKAQQGSNTSGVMLGLTRTTPTFDNSNGNSNPAANPSTYEFLDGTQRSYRGGIGYDNPYWSLAKNKFGTDLNRIFGFGIASYDLFKWLTIAERVGGDVYSQNDKNTFDVGSNTGFTTQGAVILTNYLNSQFNSDFTLNLHKDIYKGLSGSLILGYNYFNSVADNTFVQGITLALPGFMDISNASSVSSSESEVRKATQAVYGDAEFSFMNMLFLGVTAREEQSSTLPSNKDKFFYPSVNLGWVFTELKPLKGSKILSYGKIRGAYAHTGNGAPIYALTTPYTSATFKDGFTNGITLPLPNGTAGYQKSSAITTVGNPNLTPEKGISYEVGAELGFLGGRINLDATYYDTKTSDVIFPASIPFSSGFAAKELNAAKLENKGIELTLNTTPIKTASGLRWDLNLNWAKNENKVLALGNGINRFFEGGFGAGEAELDAKVGEPLNTIYGATNPHSDLLNLNSPLLIDDIVSDGSAYGQPLGGATGPSQVIGNATPKWIGSVQSNLTYLGFTFGFQFDIKHGGDIWNGTRGALANKGTAKETDNRGTPTVFKGLLGHLDANGNVVHYASDGITEVPGPGASNTVLSSYDQNYWQNIGNSFGAGQETDIEDGSYTKLRQISLTYQLPKQLFGKAKFTSIAVTIFANNVYTWTSYDGVDPETNLSGPSTLQGLDYFNNPSTKSYGVRLNVGL